MYVCISPFTSAKTKNRCIQGNRMLKKRLLLSKYFPELAQGAFHLDFNRVDRDLQ